MCTLEICKFLKFSYKNIWWNGKSVVTLHSLFGGRAPAASRQGSKEALKLKIC